MRLSHSLRFAGAAVVVVAAGALTPPQFRAGFLVAALSLIGISLIDDAAPRWQRHVRDALAAIAPLLLLAALYHPALRGFWMGDDAAILAAIATRGVVPHLFEPAAWQAFSSANFTPWVIVSFGLDWAMGPARAWIAYCHQWISLCVVLVLAHVVLRRWLGRLGAAAALGLFVASVPVATVSQWLMTRHYVEGLGFALAAIWAYRRADAGGRRWAWFAAGAYLCGAAAKEVVVPLVAVLPFLATGRWSARLRELVPTLLAAAGYAAWRIVMLGTHNALGGYGTLFSPATTSSGTIVGMEAALGLGAATLAAVAVLMAIFAADAMRRRAGPELAAAAVVAVAVVAPLVPVRAMLQPRMVLVASFCLCVGAAAGLTALGRGRRGMVVALGGMLLIAGALHATARSESWRDRTFVGRYRVEGRFLLAGSADQVLLGPLGPPWYVAGLSTVRRELGRGPAPRVCYDPCLCGAAAVTDRALRAADGALVPAVMRGENCPTTAGALRVELSYDVAAHLVTWRLGPGDAGSWRVIDPDGYATDVPATGSYPLLLTTPVEVRFAYRSASGVETVSPPLVLDPASAGADRTVRVSFSRGAPGG